MVSKNNNVELCRWIAGCRQGIRRFQQKLFQCYYSPMLRLCMRYADSTDEAEDMLNEGFLKVFSNLDKYKDTGSFESWMKRVMVNAALDYRRKYDAQISFTDISEVEDSLEMGFDLNRAVEKISSEELISLIQQLPPTTRMVFNLFVFEGFSHAEIAAQLGMSVGTSSWHVNAARTRLKNEICKLNNE